MDSFKPACYEEALACCTSRRKTKSRSLLMHSTPSAVSPILTLDSSSCSWQICNERIHLLCSFARRQIKGNCGSCILAVRNFLVTSTPSHPSDTADQEVFYHLSFPACLWRYTFVWVLIRSLQAVALFFKDLISCSRTWLRD